MLFFIENLHILIGFIFLLITLYIFLTKKYKYWESIGINGPKPIPLLGTSYEQYINPITHVEIERNRKYGKIYGIYNGNSPALTIADPELIKSILVKDFNVFRNRRPNPSVHPVFSKVLVNARDGDWKRIRAITTQTFTSGKIKKMSNLIHECLSELIENLNNNANSCSEIELKRFYGAYTMDVIAKCFFATDANTYKNPDNPFVKNANSVVMNQWRFLLSFIVPSFITKLPLIKHIFTGFSLSGEFFIEVVRHLIHERKERNEKHNDFLQLLMDVERSTEEDRYTDTSDSHHINEGSDELSANVKALTNVIEKRLEENEILAQSFIFIIAGYETTATTLSFCTYELALHPQVQEKLYYEVKMSVDNNGQITYETLSKLDYLDAVLSETLRLYPQTPRLSRESADDYVIGNTGITLRRNIMIEIPVYAIHHNHEYYHNPEAFIPERFMPENRVNLIPYTYLPFGVGPRNCVGMRFALFEAKLALIHLIQRFKFFRTANTDVPPKFLKGTRFLDSERLVIGIEKR